MLARPITNKLEWLKGKPWIKVDVPKHMWLVCPACKSNRTRKDRKGLWRICMDCKNTFDWLVYYIETVRG